MTLNEAIQRLDTTVDPDEADKIVCDVLRHLGFAVVADAFARARQRMESYVPLCESGETEEDALGDRK
jgi:hypothetical protein